MDHGATEQLTWGSIGSESHTTKQCATPHTSTQCPGMSLHITLLLQETNAGSEDLGTRLLKYDSACASIFFNLRIGKPFADQPIWDCGNWTGY